MNAFIATLLAQDALIIGSIYALIAITLVMLFSVTRIVFVPLGELISYTARTLATLQAGRMPGTAWVLVLGGVLVAGIDLIAYARGDRTRSRLIGAALYGLAPLLVLGVTRLMLHDDTSLYVRIVLTFLIVAPLGPVIYRLAFEPLANASVLVLLMVAVAVQLVMVGLGLILFGAEGVRALPLFPSQIEIGGLIISMQALFVIATAGVLMIAMLLFFGRTLHGKALRATAMNRVGARIVGIKTSSSGILAFFLAGLIGAVSGILIGPITTVYYDTGFQISLKGFMAAIVGGLASYPLAVLGSLAISFSETISSFYWNSFKDAIVFALIIPILVWRSLSSHHAEEDEE